MASALSSAFDNTNPFGIMGERNPRGIPAVTFIEDVEKVPTLYPRTYMHYCVLINLAFSSQNRTFMKQDGANTELILKLLQELYSKYKFMEIHMLKNKAGLKKKIPDIEKTLECVNHLIDNQEEGKPVKTNFCLSDNIYAEAEVQNTGTVCLWLGANVMLEYSYEEAATLLARNLKQADVKLRDANEDLNFLKDQITTTEVSMARVYNHDVKVRRATEKAAKADTE